MKIAWFSPFARESAIGRYSQSITSLLSKQCEVDLWLPHARDMLDTNVRTVVFDCDKTTPADLQGYDLLVFNMGNCLPFHRDIYSISQRFKGVVILHDFIMHNFFTGYYFEYQRDPEQYIREMERLYGPEGKRRAINSWQGIDTPVWETDEVTKYPFFEKVIEGAFGVITHSHFLAEKAREKKKGALIAVIDLPLYSYNGLIGPSVSMKDEIDIKKNKVMLVTIGHVNSNKRIDKVIEVLGKSKELSGKVTYTIIGPCENKTYFNQLQALVERYHLQDVVTFLGYQPDNVLYSYMKNADIFINLRYPATEGASYSLIEELYFEKPAIVANTGFYRELPDDCVIKISLDSEEADLRSALGKLVNDEPFRREKGLKGKKFAENRFSAEKYCQEFLLFADNVCRQKPLLQLMDRVSSELSMMGVREDSPVIDKVADEIYNIAADVK